MFQFTPDLKLHSGWFLNFVLGLRVRFRTDWLACMSGSQVASELVGIHVPACDQISCPKLRVCLSQASEFVMTFRVFDIVEFRKEFNILHTQM